MEQSDSYSKFQVVWNVTPCRLVDTNRRFVEAQCPRLQVQTFQDESVTHYYYTQCNISEDQRCNKYPQTRNLTTHVYHSLTAAFLHLDHNSEFARRWWLLSPQNLQTGSGAHPAFYLVAAEGQSAGAWSWQHPPLVPSLRMGEAVLPLSLSLSLYVLTL